MDITFRHGKRQIILDVPNDSLIYASHFPEPDATPEEAVRDAIQHPIGSPPLHQVIEGRKKGDVVVVVSDITRPLPYALFLPSFLNELEEAGIQRDEILILIATGMHRPSTPEERIEMFGEAANRYRIMDHRHDIDSQLTELPQKSQSGSTIHLNRTFLEAGFRIVTGLVEPHFMVGFSGGRKAVCPGLASLETIQKFHGFDFLDHPMARNGQLQNNPCHEEALSIAQSAGVDFSLNVVLDKHRRLIRAYAGELNSAHLKACEFVRAHTCCHVEKEADIVVTSSGGYPLDATFYQCVKGFVSCLPAVKKGGIIISFGQCSEGVGSREYTGILKRYSGRWKTFLRDIEDPDVFTNDQWEFQMQTRTLHRVGQSHLHFISDGLDAQTLSFLSVTGHGTSPDTVNETVQAILDSILSREKTLALFPEGPYCVPLES